jgi:NADH-quinone oxidoreductase subunit K
MEKTALLMHYLLVGTCLFGLGTIGFLSRRNLIVMFLSVELMLQGVVVNFAGWDRYHGQSAGQVFILFVVAVAGAEAAIALALIVNLVSGRQGLDVLRLQQVREDIIPPPLPIEDEIGEAELPSWPKLPRVGRPPSIPQEVLEYRPDV